MRDTMFIKELGERLRDLRRQKMLSQTKLASLAGLQPSAVSHLEAGRREPRVTLLVRLARAMQVGVGDLIPAA